MGSATFLVLSGGTGMGAHMREDNVCVFRGQAVSGGTGMGPREGRGWIPVCVFTGAGCERGDGDGSPHPRGQREGMGSRLRLHGGKL